MDAVATVGPVIIILNNRFYKLKFLILDDFLLFEKISIAIDATRNFMFYNFYHKNHSKKTNKF